jgi:hypothetical protein
MPEITYMDDNEFNKICSDEGFKKNGFTDTFEIISNNGIAVKGEPVKIRYKTGKVVTYSYEDYWKGIEWYQLLSARVLIQDFIDGLTPR